MKIVPASIDQAESIASLIMMAMNHECCQNFAGPHHSLADFHRMMTSLVRRDDSQYSYRNAMVALDDTTADGHPVVAGVIVGYDGADLHRLREAFLQAAQEFLDQDFRGMDDETGRRVLHRLACCRRALSSPRTRNAAAKKAHRPEGAETARRTARRQRQSRSGTSLSQSGL